MIFSMSSVLGSRDCCHNCKSLPQSGREAIKASRLFYLLDDQTYMYFLALWKCFWRLWHDKQYVQCLRVTCCCHNCKSLPQSEREAIKCEGFNIFWMIRHTWTFFFYESVFEISDIIISMSSVWGPRDCCQNCESLPQSGGEAIKESMFW